MSVANSKETVMIAKLQRRAFTLIEILIVLGIIVAVAAIFVPVVLNLSDRNQVPKAASILENALSISKARAVSERRPNGIRLIAAADRLRTTTGGQAFAWFDEIQYIEVPSDYVEHWVWGIADATSNVVQPFWSTSAPVTGPAAPSPGMQPMGLDVVSIASGPYSFLANTLVVDSNGSTNSSALSFPRSQCIFGPISILAGINEWIANSGSRYRSQRFQFNLSGNTPPTLLPGDRIEISGVGEIYTVLAVTLNNIDIAIAPSSRVFVPVIVLDRVIPTNIAVPVNGRPNYRVIRQPRAVPTLSSIKLPQDVVIDLTPTRGGAADLDTSNTIFMSGVSKGIGVSNIFGINPTAVAGEVAPTYVDIMFSPAGEIMPTSQRFRNGANLGAYDVGSSGLIAMWLHSRGDPNLWAARQATAAQGNADNQAIVAINARTGFIGSYPMTPLSISTDPLQYARLGKARISADTGQ